MFIKILLGVLCFILLTLTIITVVSYFKGEEDSIGVVVLRLLVFAVIFIPSFNYLFSNNSDEKIIAEKDFTTNDTIINDKNLSVDNEKKEEKVSDKQVSGKKYNPYTGEWTEIYMEESSEKITSNGGLGDALGILKEQYGDYVKELERISFRNGSIYTHSPYSVSNQNTFSEDDLIWNITVNFEETDNPVRTENEVLELAKSLIPKDSIQLDQTEVILSEDYTTLIINYKSDLLAKRINVQNLYGDAEIGMFSIHLNKYTGNYFEKGYFQFGITTGNPQP